MNAKMISCDTAAVLLPAAGHGPLGIARSLGSLGVPVFAVGTDRLAPVFSSRYCRGRLHWNFDAALPAESVSFLLEEARGIGGRPLLIPTTDRAALFVADNAAALSHGFRFPAQEAAVAHGLANKATMFELARRFGIPTPDTFLPRSRREVLEFSATARYPVMLKALDYKLPLARGEQPKQFASNAAALLDSYDRMQGPEQPNLVIQEYIPGGDDCVWMFNGYFDAGSKCLFGITGRKIRQCPVYTGATCLGVCEANAVVYDLTVRLMSAVGYRGILDIGYRYDRRDDTYKLLDANPRIGSTFRLFVGSGGLDVARALYLDLTGQPVPPSTPQEGRKWLVEDWDVVSSIRYWSDGNLSFQQWLQSFRGVRETALFSLRDPLAALPALFSDLIEIWDRTSKALAARLPGSRRKRAPDKLPRQLSQISTTAVK